MPTSTRIAPAPRATTTAVRAGRGPRRRGDGWSGSELTEDDWSLTIPAGVVAELRSSAARLLRSGSPRPFALPTTALDATRAFAGALFDRIVGPLGFSVVTGFPTDGFEEPLLEEMLWLLGLALGSPVSQSRKGDFIGRVEDRGADTACPTQRGYESAAALAFHCDRTDLVALLCVRPAAQGGRSRLVSSERVAALLRERHPAAAAELEGCLPHDQRGEEPAGQAPWCALPVFSHSGGDFAARYVRRFVEASSRHHGAPPLTARQVHALEAVDAILEEPGVALEMDLAPGDLQVVDNFRLLHARTAFHDDGPSRRLMLRLWLAFAGSPQLPPEYSAMYGAVGRGTYRGGIWGDASRPIPLGAPIPRPDPATGTRPW